MSMDLFLAMLGYGFAMSATPGPNTLLLFASGVNFGFRRTIPHMLGIIVGLGMILTLVGAGLGALLLSMPALIVAMKGVSIAYMLWLAWKIAMSGAPDPVSGNAEPFTWLQAALFQWVNPKAWAMALTGVAAYTRPDAYPVTLGVFIAILLGLSYPVTAAWVAAGVRLRAFLANPAALKAFNRAMAFMLVASLWPIVRDLAG